MVANKVRYNILVIEDNAGDFTLVEEFLLEQIGDLNLSHAKNYKEAREILSTGCNKFDVILLDLSLPDKTGIPLIQEIVAVCVNVPIIVLTGYADFNFGAKSLSLGVSDYILKEELTSISLYKSILYSFERKKVTIALRESETQYSELFHLSPQPMWVFDLGTLMFLSVNNAAIEQYGYSQEEFLLMNITEIRPKEEIGKLAKAIVDSTDGRLYHQGIFTHKKRSGETMQVDIQVNSIQFQGREARLVLANDVTERLSYIQAIETQNQKLREISWIQSHVVRAPLARILGLVQVMTEMKCVPDEQAELLGYLQHSSNELDNVIRQITEKTNIQGHDKYIKQLNLSDCERQFFDKLALELTAVHQL